MAEILLISKDWKARAPLRAQLLEEGLEVEAHETVGEALLDLDSSPVLPALILADLSSSDDPAMDATFLASWSREITVWIIARSDFIGDKIVKNCGFEKVLVKPLDVGPLVEQIRQHLKA